MDESRQFNNNWKSNSLNIAGYEGLEQTNNNIIFIFFSKNVVLAVIFEVFDVINRSFQLQEIIWKIQCPLRNALSGNKLHNY